MSSRYKLSSLQACELQHHFPTILYCSVCLIRQFYFHFTILFLEIQYRYKVVSECTAEIAIKLTQYSQNRARLVLVVVY